MYQFMNEHTRNMLEPKKSSDVHITHYTCIPNLTHLHVVELAREAVVDLEL